MSDQATRRTFEGIEVPAAGTYQIDPAHSEVGFVVRHLMVSKVRGRFGDFAGSITIADDPLASTVTATAQAASIDTRDAQRDEHLRSADFLDAERYPTLELRSTGLRHAGGERFALEAELTIHGITKPVTFDLELAGLAADPWGGERLGLSAKAEIAREDFGLTWNQALESGGVVVGKKVTIELEVEAVRQS